MIRGRSIIPHVASAAPSVTIAAVEVDGSGSFARVTFDAAVVDAAGTVSGLQADGTPIDFAVLSYEGMSVTLEILTPLIGIGSSWTVSAGLTGITLPHPLESGSGIVGELIL